MEVTVTGRFRLRFASGDPVRAASGVAPLRDGWLIAQDDAVFGAWWRPGRGTVEPVRLLPRREGKETFSEAAGTKHLKPDLEAACPVPVGRGEAVLLLGSGSLPVRTVGVLVRDGNGPEPLSRQLELASLYERVRATLDLPRGQLNLEGACVVDDRLRWFQRGLYRHGVPSASVDLDLAALLSVFEGAGDLADVAVGHVRRYRSSELDGLRLAITDAVSLPAGRVCVSATAEDTPDPVADGPVVGSALALIGRDGDVDAVVELPGELAGCKVEGLAAARVDESGATLLAVVDQDDPDRASIGAWLQVSWYAPSDDVTEAF